jgi:hypothetical protein
MAVILRNGRTALSNSRTPPPGRFIAPNNKTVYCRDADTAIILGYIARRWHHEVEKLVPATHNLWPDERKGHIVIHAYRPPGSTTGQGSVSVHRGGDGMDIYGERHPYERDVEPGTYDDGFSPAQREKVREICRSVRTDAGLVVARTGLDFEVGLRDGMHVEIGFKGVSGGNRTPFSAAEIRQAADRIRGTIVDKQQAGAGVRRPRGVSAQPGATNKALVRCIQRRVSFFVPQKPFDGKYGPHTAAGVKGLQKSVGFKQSGLYGPNLARADFKRKGVVSRGDRGSYVRLVQFVARVEPDGVFGSATEQAVKELQAGAGLVADGIFGPRSAAVLIVA